MESKLSELQLERSTLLEKLELAEKEATEAREAKHKIKASLDLAYQKEQFRLMEENSRLTTDLKVAQQQIEGLTRQKDQMQTETERLRGSDDELRAMQVDLMKIKTTLQLVQGRPCESDKMVVEGVVQALRSYLELKKTLEVRGEGLS